MDAHRLVARMSWLDRPVGSLVRAGSDQWSSVWRWGLAPGSPEAFAFAVICVAMATLVHVSFGLIRAETVVFSPYYAATLFAALVGGGWAGFLAMTLGGVVAYSLFAPAHWSAVLFTAESRESWALYSLSSAAILCGAVSYRRLLQRLREEEQKRQLLNRELAHRLRNLLASAQAIVSQSLADEKELRAKIIARLAALAATNDLLCASDWEVASFRDILNRELTPFEPSRFHLHGEDVQLSSAAATVIALVVHELATNAAKYGALSNSSGWIEIQWQVTDATLSIIWIEYGCTDVMPPTRSGFGTKLLQCALGSFGGQVERVFDPSGLRCKVLMPLRHSGQ